MTRRRITDEERTEQRRAAARERQARSRARRRLQIDENAPEDAAPPSEDFIPGENEFYEYNEGNLSGTLPLRIRQLARHTKGAAKEEVLRWMAPMILSGATAIQIGQIFNISTATSYRWRSAYMEMVRKKTVELEPVDAYSAQKDRIDTMRRYVFTQITNLDQAPGEQPLALNAEPAELQAQLVRMMQQANQHGNRRNQAKVALISKFIELERVELALNDAYGIADPTAFKASKQQHGDKGGQEQGFLKEMKGFWSELASIQEEEAENSVLDMLRAEIARTPDRLPPGDDA